MSAYMPIIGTCLAIRMDVLNEEQARTNHGQSLARLAERGGLSSCEALAILKRERWRSHSASNNAQLLAELAIEFKRRATTGDRSDDTR